MKWRSISMVSLGLNVLLLSIVCIGLNRRLSLTVLTDFRVLRTSSRWARYEMSKRDFFDRMKVAKGGKVFLGDSLIEGGNWREWLGDESVQNLGIGGETTADILCRISQVVDRQPSLVVTEMGINDVGRLSTEETLKNYRSILAALRQRNSPRILITSITPTTDPKRNAEILAINEGLKRLSGEFGCSYFDLYSRLATKDGISENFTIDGVHLNAYGYSQWIDLLLPAFTPCGPTGMSVGARLSSRGFASRQ